MKRRQKRLVSLQKKIDFIADIQKVVVAFFPLRILDIFIATELLNLRRLKNVLSWHLILIHSSCLLAADCLYTIQLEE